MWYIMGRRRPEMSNAELLIEEIKTLSAGRVAEVLDFVEFIKQKDTCNAEKADSDESWIERGEECPICAKHRDGDWVLIYEIDPVARTVTFHHTGFIGSGFIKQKNTIKSNTVIIAIIPTDKDILFLRYFFLFNLPFSAAKPPKILSISYP
jgi:mRNA-degrading endonuclease RelE of RelBE toxin-antitoxin system